MYAVSDPITTQQGYSFLYKFSECHKSNNEKGEEPKLTNLRY